MPSFLLKTSHARFDKKRQFNFSQTCFDKSQVRHAFTNHKLFHWKSQIVGLKQVIKVKHKKLYYSSLTNSPTKQTGNIQKLFHWKSQNISSKSIATPHKRWKHLLIAKQYTWTTKRREKPKTLASLSSPWRELAERLQKPWQL